MPTAAEEEENILSMLKEEKPPITNMGWLTYSRHARSQVRRKVAQHIRCPDKALEVLSNDSDSSIRDIASMRLGMRLNSRK